VIRATLADLDTVNALLGRDFPGIDFTEVLSEPLHVCLLDGDSGAIFMFRGPGIYEVHVFFAVTGRAAISLCHRMFDTMRAEYGAKLFWTAIPVESRKVTLFARWMGWKSEGVRETRTSPCEIFVSENWLCHL
jgi:hypothetical protein